MATRKAMLALKGETFSFSILKYTENGEEIDLTGHTLTFIVKNEEGEVLEGYEQEVEAMPVTIKMPVEEVETWPLGNNKHVLSSTAPNGDVRHFMYGPLTVKEVG